MATTRSRSKAPQKKPTSAKSESSQRIGEIFDPSLLKLRSSRTAARKILSRLKEMHPNVDFGVTHFTLCRIVDGEQWLRVLSQSEGLDYLNRAISNNIDYSIQYNEKNYITIFENNSNNLKNKSGAKAKALSLTAEMKQAAAKSGVEQQDWVGAVLARASHTINAGQNETLRINLASDLYQRLLEFAGSRSAVHEWLPTAITYSVQSGEAARYERKYAQDTRSGVERLGTNIPDYVFDELTAIAENGPISRNSLAVTIVQDLLERAEKKAGITPDL